ncbi:hypothetical protein HY091_00790 [Candidatus Kaiserbacteria bacterium]|nr:hypothetical protein [Candidatus Kaiserbacteria bacterium]
MNNKLVNFFFPKRFGRQGRVGRLVAAENDDLIRQALKAGVEPAEAARYSVEFFECKHTGYHTVNASSIYWESKSGFVLSYNGRAIACTAVEVKRTHLFIKQVQGVSGFKQELGLLRWERLLFKIAAEYARALGLREARSIRSEDQRYYPENGRSAQLDDHRQRAERMHVIYDKTPLRLGFRWSAERNAFVLPLACG